MGGLWKKFEDDILGDPFGSYEAEAGAKDASRIQKEAADAGIGEQRRQYEIARQIQNPYVQLGYQAIGYNHPQQPQQFADGGLAYDNGYMGGNIPQGAREKPGFNGVVMNDQGTVTGSTGAQGTFRTGGNGTPPTMQTYGEAGMGALPVLDQYSQSGTQALPQMQNYAQGGMNAYTMQQDIAGVNGPEAQQAAYDLIESEPGYKYMVDKAKTGILSGGSATGNLGSGRMGNALMEYQPEILSNAINQKYGMLAPMASSGQNASQYLMGTGGNVAQGLYSGGQQATTNMAQLGQSAASNTAAGALQTGGNIANLMGQKGSAEAGGSLARGSGGSLGEIAKLGVSLYGSGALDGLGGKAKNWFGGSGDPQADYFKSLGY